MTPAEVHALAVQHGLNHEQAITATAIAWAESGLRPDASGDENLHDGTWGPSVGLYQVRSLRADTGTGKERDVDRLTDPSFNSRSMVAISAGGTNWTPWSVFKNGKYQNHLDAVRAAVEGQGGTTMNFVSRSEWGARDPGGITSAPGMSRGVAVHWLGPGSSVANHAGCAAQMRQVQAYHVDSNGWADFAYNAAACRHGYVFEGRGPRVRNAANGGGTRAGADANAAWASILYLEGTDGPGLTAEGQDAINDAAEWLGVAAGEWFGHRDFLSTECPGDRIYGWVHAGHPRSTGKATPPAPAPSKEDQLFSTSPVRTVHLIASHSGLLLTSSGEHHGAGVIQRRADGSLNQRWEVWGHDDGTISLVNRAGGLALDRPDYSTEAGTLLQVARTEHNAAQRWSLDEFRPHLARLWAPGTNRCLDVHMRSVDDGAGVQLWYGLADEDEPRHQQFTLAPTV